MRILFVIDTYDTNNNGSSISAQRIAEEVLTLPIYADLPLETVDRICDILLD